MNRARASLVAVVSACLAIGLAPARAEAQPFPRLGLYGQVLGDGFPYVKGDQTLDTLEISRVSRFQQVILDAYIVPYRTDILQAIRARNPQVKLLAYVLANDIWDVNAADSSVHMPTIINHTVRDLNGFLYDKNTGQKYTNSNINIAKKDIAGRYVVAIALANIFRDHVINTGQ